MPFVYNEEGNALSLLLFSTKCKEVQYISLFCVLPVNYREMYILKFILTFRLALDARLHQKTELRAEKPTLSESSKNIAIDTKIFD